MGRGYSKCKGPRVGAGPAPVRNSRKHQLAGEEWERGAGEEGVGEAGHGDGGAGVGPVSCRGSGFGSEQGGSCRRALGTGGMCARLIFNRAPLAARLPATRVGGGLLQAVGSH